MPEVTTFTATLYDSVTQHQFQDVVAFQSRDGSGGFSIWPGQVDFIALADSGISTLRQTTQTVYIAAPQLLIEFNQGRLTLSGRKLFINTELSSITTQLQEWLQQERSQRQIRSKELKEFEQQLVQKLIRLEQQ